jgi:hypothetical protein
VIRSHLVALLTFSALTAAVFALVTRNDNAARLRLGLKIFGSFLLSSLAAAWLMSRMPN